MNRPASLNRNKQMSIDLDEEFASELRAFGISQNVIDAMRIAMANITFEMTELGFGYARWMRQTLIEYGLAGVKNQTECMIRCMDAWDTEESIKCKEILETWYSK